MGEAKCTFREMGRFVGIIHMQVSYANVLHCGFYTLLKRSASKNFEFVVKQAICKVCCFVYFSAIEFWDIMRFYV
jgi:hypothetical protein